MKRKINIQLVLIAMLAVISTTIGITIVCYNLFQKQVREDLKTNAKILEETGLFEDKSRAQDISLNINYEDLRISWIDSDGTVIYDNDTSVTNLENHADRPEVKEAFEKGIGESVRNSDTMNMNTFYYAILLENNTVLRVAVEARNMRSVFATATPLVFSILLAIIIICV